jgi:hypothetical protein
LRRMLRGTLSLVPSARRKGQQMGSVETNLPLISFPQNRLDSRRSPHSLCLGSLRRSCAPFLFPLRRVRSLSAFCPPSLPLFPFISAILPSIHAISFRHPPSTTTSHTDLVRVLQHGKPEYDLPHSRPRCRRPVASRCPRPRVCPFLARQQHWMCRLGLVLVERGAYPVSFISLRIKTDFLPLTSRFSPSLLLI